MYLYYDSNGVLQEQINDSAIVQGETCNIIYCYFAGLDLTSKSFQLTLTRVSSGTSTRTIDGVVTPNVTIPYNSKRDLRYFQYYYPDGTNTGYTMVAFALNSATDLTTSDTYAGNPLIVGGTSDFYEPITFNVESNHITANEAITSSQYTYLLGKVSAGGDFYPTATTLSFNTDTNSLSSSITRSNGSVLSSSIVLPFLPLSGGTMSGQLNMSDKLIVGTFTSEGLTEGYDLSIVGVSFNYSYTGTQKQILYGLDRITFNPNGTLTSGNEYIMHFPSESGTFALTSDITSALSSYSTTEQMNSAITSALSPYLLTSYFNSTISNYPTITQMNDAITAGTNTYLPLAGGTMAGNIVMNGHSILNNDGTTYISSMNPNAFSVNQLDSTTHAPNGVFSSFKDTLIQVGNGTSNFTLNFPYSNGTLALTSDLDGYLPLTGGYVTQPIYIGPNKLLGDYTNYNVNGMQINYTKDGEKVSITYGRGFILSTYGSSLYDAYIPKKTGTMVLDTASNAFTGANTFAGTTSFGQLPTYNSSPLIAQSTLESVIDANKITLVAVTGTNYPAVQH